MLGLGYVGLGLIDHLLLVRSKSWVRQSRVRYGEDEVGCIVG